MTSLCIVVLTYDTVSRACLSSEVCLTLGTGCDRICVIMYE